MTAESDLVVVGAGIAGLAHAIAAIERGLTVTIIERDSRAVGASVRNFGHACVTAQSGELLELALASREKWLRYSRSAGFFSVESGALAVARSRTELDVLTELSASRDPGQVRLLTAAESRDRLGADSDHRIIGGALLRDDLRVDPREAVGALAAWLGEQPGVSILWRTSYLGTEGTTVHTSRGDLTAAHTIVCVGHDLDLLFPDIADEFDVVRCALQMAVIEVPSDLRIAPAVLTGTSMLRYPAFVETSSAAALRDEVGRNSPELLDIVANVMFTQRPDGTVIVGDSHSYDLTHGPFLDEQVSDILIAAVGEILGVSNPRVLQRWQGVYASSGRQPYLSTEVDATTTVAIITSGVGMTISLGVADLTLDRLVVRPQATPR